MNGNLDLFGRGGCGINIWWIIIIIFFLFIFSGKFNSIGRGIC